MKKAPYDKPLSLKELAVRPDSEIDYSDIPELGDEFWKGAELVEPDRTQPVTLRVKQSVIDAYKSTGKGYQTRMNTVLETYAKSILKQG